MESRWWRWCWKWSVVGVGQRVAVVLEVGVVAVVERVVGVVGDMCLGGIDGIGSMSGGCAVVAVAVVDAGMVQCRCTAGGIDIVGKGVGVNGTNSPTFRERLHACSGGGFWLCHALTWTGPSNAMNVGGQGGDGVSGGGGRPHGTQKAPGVACSGVVATMSFPQLVYLQEEDHRPGAGFFCKPRGGSDHRPDSPI